MSKYYRIYCNVENEFKYLWGSEPPVLCPTDENHEINNNSITQQQTNLNIVRIDQSDKKISLSSSIYKKISTFTYLGTNEVGYLKKLVLNNYMDGGTNDLLKNNFGYYFRIFDVTNNLIIYESDFINGQILSSSYIIDGIDETLQSNYPAQWQMQIKKGLDGKDLYVDAIDLYFYQI